MSLTPEQLLRAEDLFLRSRLGKHLELQLSGCWLWTGTKRAWGYGYVNWRGKHYSAHRLIYELVVGPIPEGKELAHNCFNNACCNPVHLVPCTHAENIAMEMAARGGYVKRK